MGEDRNLGDPGFQDLQAGTIAERALTAGASVARVDSEMFQAVQVLPPRNLEKFAAAMETEAGMAGVAFFYQWDVTSKDGKKSLIIGPSFGMARRMLLNYGKAVVSIAVAAETSRDWTFSATFVDLETGVSFNRLFQQRKVVNIGKKMDEARALDIAFQIGMSKATRNVILAAMPQHLIDRCIERAQEQELVQIEKAGVIPSRNKTVGFLARHGVTDQQIEAVFGKPLGTFTAQNVVELRGMARAIHEGASEAHVLFPPVVDDEKEKGAAKAEAAAALVDEGGQGKK
jgi:hypothetical protein